MKKSILLFLFISSMSVAMEETSKEFTIVNPYEVPVHLRIYNAASKADRVNRVLIRPNDVTLDDQSFFTLEPLQSITFNISSQSYPYLQTRLWIGNPKAEIAGAGTLQEFDPSTIVQDLVKNINRAALRDDLAIDIKRCRNLFSDCDVTVQVDTLYGSGGVQYYVELKKWLQEKLQK